MRLPPSAIMAVVLLPYLGLPVVRSVSTEKRDAENDLETGGGGRDDVDDDRFYEFEDKLLRLWLEHIIDRYNTNAALSSEKSKNIQRIAKKGRTSSSSSTPPHPRNKNIAPFPIYPLLFNPSYHPAIYSNYVPLHHGATGHQPIPVPPTEPCTHEMYHHQVVLPLHTRLPYVYTHFMSPHPNTDYPYVENPTDYHAYVPELEHGVIRKYELVPKPQPTYAQTEYPKHPNHSTGTTGTEHAPPVENRPEESVRIEHKKNDVKKDDNKKDDKKPNDVENPVSHRLLSDSTAAVEPDATTVSDKTTVDSAETYRTTEAPMTVPEKSSPPETVTAAPVSHSSSGDQLPDDGNASKELVTEHGSTAAQEPSPTVPVTEQPENAIENQTVTASDNDFAETWNEHENTGIQREAEPPRPRFPNGAEKATKPAPGYPDGLTTSSTSPDPTTTKRSSMLHCKNGECRTTRSVADDESIPKKSDRTDSPSPRNNDDDDQQSNLISQVAKSTTSKILPTTSSPLSQVPEASASIKPSNSKTNVAENDAEPSTSGSLSPREPLPTLQPQNGRVTVNSIPTEIKTQRVQTIATDDATTVKRIAKVPMSYDEMKMAGTSRVTVKLEPLGQTTRNSLPSDVNLSTKSYPSEIHENTEKTNTNKNDNVDSRGKTKSSFDSPTMVTNPRESNQEHLTTTVSVTDDSNHKRSTDDQNGFTTVTVASETLKDSDLWYEHMRTLNPRKKELNEEQINFLLKKLIKLLKPEIEKQMLTEENMARFIVPKIKDQDKLVHVIFPWVRDAAKNMDNDDDTTKINKNQNIL